MEAAEKSSDEVVLNVKCTLKIYIILLLVLFSFCEHIYLTWEVGNYSLCQYIWGGKETTRRAFAPSMRLFWL